VSEPEPIPAATVIVMRDRPGAPPELLMVERARAMSFAGGALVFPGGRVDPADRALAAVTPGDHDEAAARIAAIRETIEEAGLGVGLDGGGDLTSVRAGLHEGRAFGELLHDAGLTLALDRLVPFARWLPSGVRHRVFDTRFYVARAPEGVGEASADGSESVRCFWASAPDVLADADAGRATIIFPTRRNLERLATFACFDEAAAHAASHPMETITPWIEDRDGARHLCIPEGLGYPVTSEPLESAMRA
jgi:8-oxo-dGTP pyrophosphatase MutT (NUDIX family)